MSKHRFLGHLLRCLILILLVSVAFPLTAKEPKWQEATFYKITTQNGGDYDYTARSLGVTLRGTITYTYYWLKTDKLIYILYIRGKAPNITLHGKTKIATKGRKAFILR